MTLHRRAREAFDHGIHLVGEQPEVLPFSVSTTQASLVTNTLHQAPRSDLLSIYITVSTHPDFSTCPGLFLVAQSSVNIPNSEGEYI